jgi:hypothetical protein
MFADVATEGNTQKLLSELATATYRAAKRQGFKDAFIDIELDLWYAHQAVAIRRASMGGATDGRGLLLNATRSLEVIY